MARNVYTVNVENNENENVTNENIKKVTKVKEDEFVCGIDLINNKSSKRRVSAKVEAGYEKHVNANSKKNMKTKFNHIDDYSDFSFKVQKSEPVKKVKVEEKVQKEEPIVVKEKTTSTVKFMPEIDELERQTNLVAEVSDRFELDDEARKIVYVARMGSLFDYEKMF